MPNERETSALVFLHGFLGFSTLGPEALGLAYFNGLRKLCKETGRTALFPKVPSTGSIKERAEALSAFLANQPHGSFILIGHSMGGLDGRYAITNLDPEKRIRGLITITTPHRGSPIADRMLKDRSVLAWLMRKFSREALADLSLEGCAHFNDATPDRPDVSYHSFNTFRWIDDHGFHLKAFSKMIPSANDGMVPFSSSLWGTVHQLEMADHMEVIGWEFGFPVFGRKKPVDHLSLYRRVLDLCDQIDSGLQSPSYALYRKSGKDLILFIHGLGCLKENFSQAFADPRFDDFSLYMPDLPGHGDNRGTSTTIPAMAEYLKTELGKLSFDRLFIVAHSMGGAVALRLIEDGKLPVAGFVNVEGNLIASDCGLLSRKTAETDETPFIQDKFHKMIAAAQRSDAPTMSDWANWAKKCPPKAFHQACTSLVDQSESDELLQIFKNIRHPKLYLYGEKSANQALLAQLEDIPRQELPECGHFMMIDRPLAFYDALLKILKH